jgi:iron complex outermembrane recepter protein
LEKSPGLFTGNKMKTVTTIIRKLSYALGLAGALSAPLTAYADSIDDIPFSKLLEMDITELMNIEVSLVSRNSERLFATPAATYVITQEDIKRSGLRSIPELLRLVPGFHVGHIDANKWAISSRFPASQFSSEMLVLMDGRTLYSPLFNGTYWNIQDTFLEDIERIEVIRGPGGSVWGANAINGIINIITKSADNTPGRYAYASVGKGEMRSEFGYRQGFEVDDKTHARVYAKTRYKDRGEYLDSTESTNNNFFPVGSEASDYGKYAQAGFRIDKALNNNSKITMQGDIYDGKSHDIRKNTFSSVADTNVIDIYGFNLDVNWKYTINDNQSLTTTAFIDVTDRHDDAFNDHREVTDIDIQHDISWGKQLTSWGLGIRYHTDDTSNSNSPSTVTPRLNLDPPSITDHLYQLFIQNKSELIINKLSLTLGSKFEHNDYSGSEYQPSARLSYTPDKKHTLWAASSRSVNTPTRGGRDLYLDFNDFIASCSAVGGTIDPNLGCILDISNTTASVYYTKELGYRNILNDQHMFDITLYYQTFNSNNTHNAGLEINTRHELTDNWQLEYWFAQQRTYTGSGDNKIYNHALQTPTMHLRSYWDITTNLKFDLLTYYVPKKQNTTGTSNLADSYTRLDAHIGWQYNKNLDIDFVITNIADDVHAEERENVSRVNTGVNRGYSIKLNYLF